MLNIKEYFNLLKETLIPIYGEENKNMIQREIDQSYICYSSSPKVSKQYLEKFKNQISKEQQEALEEVEIEYNKAKKLWYLWFELKLKEFLNTLIDLPDQVPLEIFTNNNFTSGLIDVLSKEQEAILNSSFAIPELKQKILE